jgi:hypothetical protein
MAVGYGHRKSENILVDTINRMSDTYKGFDHHAFLGFIPVSFMGVGYGLDIDDESYVGCHIFCPPNDWGEKEPKIPDVRKIKPWVLMFMGVCGMSYYARFRTEQDAIDYFNKIEVYNKQVENRCFLLIEKVL